MKKKNVAKMFFTSLLKSLICIVIVLGVGVISYKISYSILSKDGGIAKTDVDSLADIKAEATTDDISRNLIYVSDEKNRVSHIMLEICNKKTHNMDYVTIPVKADYTIPSMMYRQLCQINQEIPQVIRLASLKKYFSSEDDAYGYGVLIFEKMLGTDISYYTAIDQTTYESQYEQKKVKVAFKTKSDVNNTPGPDGTTLPSTTTVKTKLKLSVLSDAYKNQLRDLRGDEEKIADYIKDQYERVVSNLTQYNKIGYVETYRQLDVDLYHYWGIPCTYADNVYSIDGKAAKKALKTLIDNDVTYTQPQDLSSLNRISAVTETSSSSTAKPTGGKSEKNSSKNLKIRILNGSQIAGLASATKQRLEEKGFKIADVGNYTDETLTTTRIVVSKKGQGGDLKEYFDSPKLTVGDVAEGYDIEIILGTRDANS